MAIIVTKENGITTVTLNRPAALNALDRQTFRELAALWPELNTDEATKVVILTGAGRAFCSGRDVKETVAKIEAGRPDARASSGSRRRAFLPASFDKPVIAAVNGAAAGGGLGLVLFCDIAICSEDAVFVSPYAGLGVMDDETLVQLIKKTTPGWAMWMALSGKRIDAQTALRIGLVNEVLPKDRLMDRARDMAEGILYNAPAAVLAIKEKMKAVMETTFRDALQNVGRYEEELNKTTLWREGFQALAEKRGPSFSSS